MDKIGIYKVERLIAKGGMGEVYLAFDPTCERLVALKKIRSDYIQYETMQKRFLNEAKIAAKLSHPSIIPIYYIHQDQKEMYYTMPFVEGDTLRDILKQTSERIKKREAPHPIGSSIPSLMRIFLSVCQAVYFCHSKGFLHRDLKPGNIMVGHFGQTLILDWGLAKSLSEKEEEIQIPGEDSSHLTRPGKAVGTLTYMAPERAFEKPASIKTEIYALGIILYQLLTLKSPFKRQTLKEFKENAKHEQLIDPSEIAPERDIPLQLSQIAKKCLAFDEKERFASVAELIASIENYIEGKPDWIFQTELCISNKKCWQVQENVVLSKHISFLKSSQSMRWVALMISKESFTGNFKIEANLVMHRPSDGIGFLFCAPKPENRKTLEEGFWLWLGTKKNPSARLYRNNVEVLAISDIYLKPGKNYHIVIEKIENHISVSLNQETILNYTTYIPIVGSHAGLICKDMNFEIANWRVYVGSRSAMVNCLSIPDAFLASKNFKKAFIEYERIHQSFKGRIEGREAIFRSGVALIEEARHLQNHEELLNKANNQFELLRRTSGAPLEYLGKSMVYHLEDQIEDEVKCLELSIRKYPNHPLLHMIEEQITFRMHESAKQNRKATFMFALLCLKLLKDTLFSKETLLLFESLHKNIDPLPLFKKPKTFKTNEEKSLYLAGQIAFWLNKPDSVLEIMHLALATSDQKEVFVSNALFSLLYMEAKETLKEAISSLNGFDDLVKLIQSDETSLPPALDFNEVRLLGYLFKTKPLPQKAFRVTTKAQKNFDLLEIKSALITHDFAKARLILDRYASEITHPLSIFYAPNLVYQMATGGKERLMESLKTLIQLRYPPITALLAHFLAGKINLKEGWIDEAFPVERKALFEQLYLLYTATKKEKKIKELHLLLDFEA
jgi:serine/threonine protein kinase